MAYSKSQKKATMKWDSANYDQIKFTVPKGEFKTKLKLAAQMTGISTRQFITDTLEKKMEETEMTITEKTLIAIENGKTYNAEELVFHTGGIVEYDGTKYILVRQASPDDVLEDMPCYLAPAVKIGDVVDEEGWCKRHYVVWKVWEDYDPENQGEDCACDWDEPYDVYESQTGQYNILTGEFF